MAIIRMAKKPTKPIVDLSNKTKTVTKTVSVKTAVVSSTTSATVGFFLGSVPEVSRFIASGVYKLVSLVTG